MVSTHLVYLLSNLAANPQTTEGNRRCPTWHYPRASLSLDSRGGRVVRKGDWHRTPGHCMSQREMDSPGCQYRADRLPCAMESAWATAKVWSASLWAMTAVARKRWCCVIWSPGWTLFQRSEGRRAHYGRG